MRFISREENKINIKKRNYRRRSSSHSPGRLSIIGIGPGNPDNLSKKAYQTIINAQVLVGYNTYLKLLGELITGKEIICSGMTQEIKRADQAIKKALEGKKVCIISSGDPGVYGIAGLVLELIKDNQLKKIQMEIIPGITAATACASLLGAPLTHDFSVISLSDLLTDKKDIEKRLKASLKADFVIVMYNPQSKTRTKPLKQAWRIIKKYRRAETPVGIVKNAFRTDQKIQITTLNNVSLLKDNIDMATTIILGNSKTYIKNGYIVTPRGYNI